MRAAVGSRARRSSIENPGVRGEARRAEATEVRRVVRRGRAEMSSVPRAHSDEISTMFGGHSLSSRN